MLKAGPDHTMLARISKVPIFGIFEQGIGPGGRFFYTADAVLAVGQWCWHRCLSAFGRFISHYSGPCVSSLSHCVTVAPVSQVSVTVSLWPLCLSHSCVVADRCAGSANRSVVRDQSGDWAQNRERLGLAIRLGVLSTLSRCSNHCQHSELGFTVPAVVANPNCLCGGGILPPPHLQLCRWSPRSRQQCAQLCRLSRAQVVELEGRLQFMPYHLDDVRIVSASRCAL